ncbi:uncharacterized protein LOC121920334 [Sceloporus undulatus]|uniref:uncharacterized protein LOC121920334 n=1 Tax=Sceloporus undulatus TaxID=8520 RepID=UPI001C4C22C4|nr:uncharacterized protein LOC121920334 [Sceloporus undulatus]
MDSHAVTESGASTQARGRVWSANEVLALLEIWKEQKLQNKLKKNYRNLDIFKDVADEMAKKNHVRSAEECRSKSKKMRFEYRKVVKHNQRSGSNPITCPFYRELEEIFHGDVSITPHRLSRSLDFEREGETTNVTEETASTSMANTGDGGTQETTTRQDSDEDSDDTCLDDTIINIPFTILESGPTQIAGATGEQLGHLERRADGTSGGTDVRNDPDEEQEQPNVLLSPGTRLRSRSLLGLLAKIKCSLSIVDAANGEPHPNVLYPRFMVRPPLCQEAQAKAPSPKPLQRTDKRSLLALCTSVAGHRTMTWP